MRTVPTVEHAVRDQAVTGAERGDGHLVRGSRDGVLHGQAVADPDVESRRPARLKEHRVGDDQVGITENRGPGHAVADVPAPISSFGGCIRMRLSSNAVAARSARLQSFGGRSWHRPGKRRDHPNARSLRESGDVDRIRSGRLHVHLGAAGDVIAGCRYLTVDHVRDRRDERQDEDDERDIETVRPVRDGRANG